MGERVVINPPPREDPPPVVPLEYGHGTPAGDAWKRFRTIVGIVFERMRDAGTALAGLLRDRTSRGVRVLGGGRQIVFAIGLASVLGGLADVLGRFSDGAGIFWMALGGILIGLSVRFPWLR